MCGGGEAFIKSEIITERSGLEPLEVVTQQPPQELSSEVKFVILTRVLRAVLVVLEMVVLLTGVIIVGGLRIKLLLMLLMLLVFILLVAVLVMYVALSS